MVRYKVDYLTDTQERILAVIRRRIAEDGVAPTVAELAAELGRSVSAVHDQLGELEAKWAIVRQPGTPRGIRLT